MHVRGGAALRAPWKGSGLSERCEVKSCSVRVAGSAEVTEFSAHAVSAEGGRELSGSHMSLFSAHVEQVFRMKDLFLYTI